MLSVDELSVDELSVDEMSVDGLSPHLMVPAKPYWLLQGGHLYLGYSIESVCAHRESMGVKK